MLMRSCILAKSYHNRVGPRLQRLESQHPNISPLPVPHPDTTWEPRKNYYDNNKSTEEVLQFQSILMDTISPRGTKNLKSVILPQIDPVDGDEYWEMYGNCKVRSGNIE